MDCHFTNLYILETSTFVPISGVTILLSLTVFSQVLADTMPATSDAIPLLGKLIRELGHPPQLPISCMPSNLINVDIMIIDLKS